ncbi:MAG: carbon-nitrogen hydrolase family protein [Crocinitomix sp.]|nr:carbon-nitrogen hydrolase family protein [Crocinitomix sp.]
MKICLAQTKPFKGNVAANIDAHVNIIQLALTFKADAIFFPELSLTGYEPELAQKLATNQNDQRLDIFQETSDKNNLIIGLGMPTIIETQIRISMLIFEPNKPRQTYSKQLLHSDECPYFENGTEQLIINTNSKKIAPAICYESLQPTHAENAFKLGADIYLASVAKPANGVEKAFSYFPNLAKQYAMPVLMANSVGFCDNFLSVGQSSVWTKNGELVGQLDDKTEGILIFDTETEDVITQIIEK